MNPGHPLQPKDWSSGTHADRFEAIRPYLEGRRVLDVGAASGHRRETWMHRLVAGVASSAVGLELDAREAASAASLGFDVRQGDAETIDLAETFDVVWAGELIEHLSCPGAFLDGVRRTLTPSGRLVLTTPNAFAVSNFVYRLGGSPRVNLQHTCWYCSVTLSQLLERHGFEVEEMRYLRHTTPGRVRRVLASAVRAALPDQLAQNTILVVARVSPG